MTAPLDAAEDKQAAQDTAAPNARPRVLVADDYAVLRDGARRRLSGAHSLEVLEGLDNVADIPRLVEALKPELVVLELWLPGMTGLPAIHELKQRSSATKILVLASHETEDYLRGAFQAGADGYVLRSAPLGELMAGIDSVLRGKRFISERVSEQIVNRCLQRGDDAMPGQRDYKALTVREREVLRMVAQGRRNREIAGNLFLSVKTVEKHRANLMHKLGLHNTAALTSFAVEHGLVGATLDRPALGYSGKPSLGRGPRKGER
jgi:DNA-binding NarL/FixJ family response regulator